MAVTLNRPIDWERADADTKKMLEGLQPNIIKAHVRDYLTVLFVRFDDVAGGKKFLRALVEPQHGPLVKSALTHLQEVRDFKANQVAGSAYVGVGLTHAGYEALGIPAAKRPKDQAFATGMRSAAKRAELKDPPVADFDPHFQGVIHAVVLVGDAEPGPAAAVLDKVRGLLPASVVVVGEETGLGLHNGNGDGIEQFGYVDGRSQPLFLTDEITDAKLGSDGTNVWEPAFAPSRVIVKDLGAPASAMSFGSYFVFRKLEQNVRLFKDHEEELAKRLGLEGSDTERAGAMIVGRFEDGTPLTLQKADGNHNPVPNNFNYDSDPEGGKCPFFAHIRKVNPRGSTGDATERRHIMARRGQTYGTRADNPNDGNIDNKPTGGVGLLFMAFNADLAQQFEFAQASWANNPAFPPVPAGANAPGIDLVMGQGQRPDIQCPKEWGSNPVTDGKITTAAPQAVTMKGGEYFFMPSLPFLASL